MVVIETEFLSNARKFWNPFNHVFGWLLYVMKPTCIYKSVLD